MPPSEVALAYDRWFATYDSDRNATRDLDALVLRSAGLTLAGARVLELGCGTGKNTEWLVEQAESVLALDFSAGMLSRARQRVTASNVQFAVHDVRERWPLDDDAVDLVIGNLVLEHVEQLDIVFSESARVLAAQGTLYCCELHPFRQWQGGQAQFVDAATGETVRVQAFVHTVSDYINAGVRAGFILQQVGEHVEGAATATALPRLLSLQFRRP